MKVNYLIDDAKGLQFIGSTTSPKYFYDYLKNKIEIDINGTQKKYDIIHSHSITPWVIIKSMNYKKKGMVTVQTVHSLIKTNQGHLIGIKSLEEKYYMKAYQQFDHLIAVSESVKEELESKGFNNVKVIHNAVNTKEFRKNKKEGELFRKEYGLSKNDFIVLNVAQTTPRKGIYDFIKISQECPEKKFIWVGGQSFSIFTKDYLKIKKVMKKKYNNLIFTGFINNLKSAYSAANIFLTPSYSETFGLTIIEAASMGLPVIARKLPEYKSIFGNNIAYAKNNQEFIKKLRTSKLSNIKTEIIKNKFSIEKQSTKLLKFYKSILTK